MQLTELANSYLTGSILTLVVPLVVFAVVTTWLVIVWARDANERP